MSNYQASETSQNSVGVEQAGTSYRSGTAARLAGIAVETLRVWERRYHITSAQRSEFGQRMYSAQEVRRLGLIKQLVDLGHAIGSIATLDDPQLEEMLREVRAIPDAVMHDSVERVARVAVVGSGLARRIATRNGGRLELIRETARLAQAAAQFRGVVADVLIVELSEMTEKPEVLEPMIAETKQVLNASKVLILYRFCPSLTIRRLRSAGHIVSRIPGDLTEIESLCFSAMVALSRPRKLPDQKPSIDQLPIRRFDDAALERVASASNSIACECPKHLVEILQILTSFERYSMQCENRDEADAALHRDLHRATAEARSLMERALERVARADGLPLPN